MENTIEESNKLIAEFMGYKYFGWNEPSLDNSANVAGWHKPTLEGNPHLPSMQKVSGWYLCRRHSELRYYNSWDWLMPVVEKIERFNFNVVILTNECHVAVTVSSGLRETEYFTIDKGETKLKATYKGVVNFIKWYSENRS